MGGKRVAGALAGVAVVVALAVGAAAAAGMFRSSTHSSAGAPQAAHGDRVGVHAAWHIEVRNPDGRTVAVRRFHNDLTFGQGILSSIMRGSQTFGWWEVALIGASQACSSAGNPAPCVIVPTGREAGITLNHGHTFGGLTTSSLSGGLELSTQAFADRAGAIDTVRTAVFMCPSSVAHDNCDDTTWQQGTSFSGRSITPLNLVAGQQILTTVDITFATA